MLLDLIPAIVQQGGLTWRKNLSGIARRLVPTLCAANLRYGRGIVPVGSKGKNQRDWTMRRERRKPEHMTRLDDVPVARA